MFLVPFLVLGVAIGYIQGGRMSALSKISLRHGSLVIMALVIQLTLFVCGFTPYSALPEGMVANIVSYMLVIAFLFLNRQVKLIEVVAAGLTLNFLAIVSNGGYMPGPTAAFASSALDSAVSSAQVANAESSLWFLGDTFTLPLFSSIGYAFSIGDLVIALGMFAIIRGTMIEHRAELAIARERYQPKHLARPVRFKESA
ncbi:MAG: DUF5317 domain-containing protein [Candidatus Aquicultor sp.]